MLCVCFVIGQTLKMFLQYTIVTLALAGIISASPLHHSASCHRVQKFYQKYLKSELTGGYQLCPTDATGCCRDLQGAIEAKAKDDFIRDFQANTKLQTISEVFTRESDVIRSLLEQIFKQTVSEEPNSQVEIANRKLFQYVNELIVNQFRHHRLTEHVEKLLEAIFVTELQRTHINAYPQDYVDCLLVVLRDLDMFIDFRKSLVQHFQRYIDISKLIIRSLELTSSLLTNATTELQLSDECVRQLASGFHCARCTKHELTVKPCGTVCQQTMAACVAHTPTLATLNLTWSPLADIFIELASYVSHSQKSESRIFTEHHGLMLKAKQLLENNDRDISDKARIACGTPTRYFRSVSNVNPYSFYNYSKSANDVPTQRLFALIQSLSQHMREYKSTFSNLPVKLCSQYADTQCWNGDHFVSVYRTDTPTSTSIVANTASVNSNAVIELEIKQLMSTIKRINSQSQMTVYELGEDGYDSSRSEQFVNEGSGSGYGSDDEDCLGPDCEEGSGSGHTGITETETSSVSNNEDIVINQGDRHSFEENEITQTTDEETDSAGDGSGSITLSLATSILLCMAIIHVANW